MDDSVQQLIGSKREFCIPNETKWVGIWTVNHAQNKPYPHPTTPTK